MQRSPHRLMKDQHRDGRAEKAEQRSCQGCWHRRPLLFLRAARLACAFLSYRCTGCKSPARLLWVCTAWDGERPSLERSYQRQFRSRDLPFRQNLTAKSEQLCWPPTGFGCYFTGLFNQILLIDQPTEILFVQQPSG